MGEAYANAISILVVEDDPMVATYILDVLEELGFVVVGLASSGSEALTLVGQTHPSLALMDVRLAGPMDGAEVAQVFRSQYRVPVIFVSGFSDAVTIERAKATQPLDLLVKTFRPSQVFNAIETAGVYSIELNP